MACTNCKQKNNLGEELKSTTDHISKGIVVFFIVWTAMGLYGLVTLISKFI